MFRFFLFIFLASSVASNPTKPPNPKDRRIVGGQDINIEDTNFLVSLQFFGQHICGGSIISSNWILTAAHCVYENQNASHYSIRAGSSIRENGGQVRDVLDIFCHTKYDHVTHENDAAVLELSTRLNFNTKVGCIRVAALDFEIPERTVATVSGWGVTSVGGYLPSQLQGVNLTIISNLRCAGMYKNTKSKIYDSMICAYTRGKDSCQGDSGGPLTVYDELQIGIVSWGISCADTRYPGVYTRTWAVFDLIGGRSTC